MRKTQRRAKRRKTGEGSDESETEEVRRAMAEAISEMEREDVQTMQGTHNDEHAPQITHTMEAVVTTMTEPLSRRQSQGPGEWHPTTAETSGR